MGYDRNSLGVMPVWVYKAKNRYQPKYERSVVKYNVVVSHTGHVVFVSGGHPGAMSDTTLARKYSPALRESDVILADLAYISIPHCLTPIKNLHGGLTADQLEFNRVFQFYRARAEHCFGWMKSFAF